MAALSPDAPTQPIDPTMKWRASRRTCLLLRNRDPRSVCRTHSATSPRRATALLKVLNAMRDLMRETIEYPAMRPENTPLTAKTFILLSRVWCVNAD